MHCRTAPDLTREVSAAYPWREECSRVYGGTDHIAGALLHNIAVKAVREGHGLSLHRPVTSDVRQGAAQLGTDLAEDLYSFKEGLVWGTERKSEWRESLNKPLGLLWAYGMQVDMARRTYG